MESVPLVSEAAKELLYFWRWFEFSKDLFLIMLNMAIFKSILQFSKQRACLFLLVKHYMKKSEKYKMIRLDLKSKREKNYTF